MNCESYPIPAKQTADLKTYCHRLEIDGKNSNWNTYIAQKYNIIYESYLIRRKEISHPKTYCHFALRLVLTIYFTFEYSKNSQNMC